MNTRMTSNELKSAIKTLGVTDRMRVTVHGATLHIYLSKAVRQNADLMTKVVALVELETGRKDLFTPGAFPRYSIVPTHEAA